MLPSLTVFIISLNSLQSETREVALHCKEMREHRRVFIYNYLKTHAEFSLNGFKISLSPLEQGLWLLCVDLSW